MAEFEDEIFEIKGKQVVRKTGENVGKLLRSWRLMRDSEYPEVKHWMSVIEIMQQPAAFSDSVINCWIAEMRIRHEGDPNTNRCERLVRGRPRCLNPTVQLHDRPGENLCGWEDDGGDN